MIRFQGFNEDQNDDSDSISTKSYKIKSTDPASGILSVDSDLTSEDENLITVSDEISILEVFYVGFRSTFPWNKKLIVTA